MASFHPFWWPSDVAVCIFTTSFCPFICRWTSGLYPQFGCCLHCYKHCAACLESTKVLLYPRGKYLALQFWNRRVALFLTSFLKFFYDSHRERGRDTGRGRSRLHAPGAQSGIRSRVSRIVPWAKDRQQTTATPKDPLFLTSGGPSTLFSTVATSVRLPTRSVRGLPFLHCLTNTCCFLCC